MKFLLILLTLFSTLAYSKSPEGKGLICAYGKNKDVYEAYLFFKKKYISKFLYLENYVYSIKQKAIKQSTVHLSILRAAGLRDPYRHFFISLSLYIYIWLRAPAYFRSFHPWRVCAGGYAPSTACMQNDAPPASRMCRPGRVITE